MIGQDADYHFMLHFSKLSAKDQRVNGLGFVGHTLPIESQLCNSIYNSKCENSHKQYIKKWTLLYLYETLFTKTGRKSNLAYGS